MLGGRGRQLRRGYGLTTASHCTARVFTNDTNPIRYPNGTLIGTGVYHPPSSGNYCVFPIVGCMISRNSDEAMYSVASTIPLRRGAIVHTTLVSTTGADGGHTVNATNPYFYIIATDGDEARIWNAGGQDGSTTGWTTGTVNHTCADKTIAGTTYPDGPTQSPYAVRCAFEASAWVAAAIAADQCSTGSIKR